MVHALCGTRTGVDAERTDIVEPGNLRAIRGDVEIAKVSSCCDFRRRRNSLIETAHLLLGVAILDDSGNNTSVRTATKANVRCQVHIFAEQEFTSICPCSYFVRQDSAACAHYPAHVLDSFNVSRFEADDGSRGGSERRSWVALCNPARHVSQAQQIVAYREALDVAAVRDPDGFAVAYGGYISFEQEGETRFVWLPETDAINR